MSKKDKKSSVQPARPGPGKIQQTAKKLILSLVVSVLLIVFLKWLLKPTSAVGESSPIQGRDHIKVGANHPSYNSNPPTSGPHYEEPVAAGVYESEYADENLIHSLEHGYVIISYNCDVKEVGGRLVGKVWAHGETEATASSQASISAVVRDESCHRLEDELKSLAEKLRGWKLIVTPRKNLDMRIALTAWGRIDKFNGMDGSRIEKFVKLYRDQGPEKTPN